MPIDAGTVTAKIRVDTATLRADLLQANTAFSTFGQQMNVSALGMAKTWVTAFAGIGTAIAAVVAIAQGLKSAVNTFAEFEQSMANVASVSKASAEDFAKLQEAAEAAGASTRFTASQAADALYYLASAGFTATQSVDALNGVLYLAGATGADLASTSETVASAISQFGLEASDAARVANVFTAAITNSQATMDKLAVSMRYVGPIAAAFGYTLEDVTGILQILYNNGYEASQAGTALRSTFADLSNAASPAIKKLNDLGVSFEEVNPATHSFSEILDVLAEAGLSAADVMAIFGDRAGPAMVTLLNEGSEAVDAYTEAVTGTNAAAVAYARQNDTLKGDLDILKSAVEGLAIAFGKELSPFLRDVVVLFTEFIGFLTDATPIAAQFFEVLTAPITYLADLGAELTSAKLAADQFSDGIAESADSLNRANQSIEDVKNLRAQSETIKTLADEYDRLSSQASLTEEEQSRLDEVVGTLAETVPEATTAFDEYGKAMEVNTGIARDYSESLLDNAEVIARSTVDSLKAQQEAAARRKADIERERAAAKQRYTETTAQLKAQEAAYKSVYAIQTTLENELALAGESNGEARRAAYQKATQALLEIGLIGETELDRLDEGARGLAEVWQISTQDILSDYRELSTQAEKNLKDWQSLEDAALESDRLLKDLAVAEQNLADIQEKKGQLQQQNNETTRETIELTQEQKAAQREAERERLKAEEEQKRRLEERRNIEEDYYRRVLEQQGDKRTLLELDYAKAIAEANRVGADKTNIEAFYAEERIRLTKEEEEEKKRLQEEGAKNSKTQEEKDFDEWKALMDEKLDYYGGWYESVASLAVGFFTALADLRQADIDNEIASLEAKTEAQLQQLDQEYQAQLEAAGLAEQTALEKAQAELEIAKASNDQKAINEAQLAVRKAQIDQNYENAKSAIEAEAAKKKAQLEYKAALAAWEARMLASAAQIPIMVLNAVASGWQAPWPASPIVAAAFGATALATGIVQTAAIAAAKPKKQNFATGGIVTGPPGTDIIDARLTAGEIVMNEAQQARLMRLLNGQESMGPGGQQVAGVLTVVLEDMGLVLAKATGPYFANGMVRLKPT